MDRPDITAPVYTRLYGIECEVGTLELPAEGEPTLTLNPELLALACRAAGIETTKGG